MTTEAQVQWLFGRWERLDSWITENRSGRSDLVPPRHR